MAALDPRQHYGEGFERFERALGAPAPAWLKALRKDAFARFAQLGFPSTAQEDWRYTSVAPIAERAFEPFVRGDAELARAVCRRDDAVDSLNDSVFRILLTHMMEDQRVIGPGMELLLVSRNLERVADLATNVAEDVVFLEEGKTIKHHAEDERPAPDGAA